MFGGNSNWRGPVWMPVNALIIRALLQYHAYYGDNFKIECPTGSGNLMNLYQVAENISKRLAGIFLKNEKGERPVYGGTANFRKIHTGRTTSCSMNISMETMERVSEQAIRQAGQE